MGGRLASLEDAGLEGGGSGRRGHGELGEQMCMLFAEAAGIVAGPPDLDDRRPAAGAPDDTAQAALGQPGVAVGAVVHLLVAVEWECALPLKQRAERQGWPPGPQWPRPQHTNRSVGSPVT